MRVTVEELFIQVERESAFDEGYDKGKLENKEETVVNMLKESFDIATIQRISGCSSNQIFKIRDKYLAGK